jgi:hypothetical protein
MRASGMSSSQSRRRGRAFFMARYHKESCEVLVDKAAKYSC